MLDNVPVIIKIARITIIAGILFGVIISIISSATFSCSVNSYSDYEYITWISSIVNSSISILVCILVVYWLRNAYKTITYNAHVLNLDHGAVVEKQRMDSLNTKTIYSVSNL
jgi:hypothetical protein